MTSRRTFIKSTSALSAAVLVKNPFSIFAAAPTIGIQLYTVRDAMQADPVGTIQKVAKIGYNSIETATYTGSEKFYGMDAVTFKKLMSDNGLVANSGHYRLGEEKAAATTKGTILNDWSKAVDDAAALGLKYMVCAYLSDEERGTLDHYKMTADKFNTAAEICHKAGIQFCYHNHAFEFEMQDGKYPYDILLGNTDKDMVKMEMDLYWVTKAKQNPHDIFIKYPGRFPLWHVKDMDKTPEGNFTEVGNGIIDFKSIFREKKLAGNKLFFVEEDKCPGSPFDSITSSYNYISKNLV